MEFPEGWLDGWSTDDLILYGLLAYAFLPLIVLGIGWRWRRWRRRRQYYRRKRKIKS